MTEESSNETPSGYVRTGTFCIAIVATLVIGIFCGNLLTTLFLDDKETARQQVTAPSNQQASQDTNSELNVHILQLERQLLSDPDNVQNWIHLGNLYFDAQEPKQAIKAYSKALELNPDNTSVLTDLGVMYRYDGQYQKAVDCFALAISLNPNHEIAHFNRGIVLFFDLKRPDEALKQWQELLAINPDAKAPNGTPVPQMIKELTGK